MKCKKLTIVGTFLLLAFLTACNPLEPLSETPTDGESDSSKHSNTGDSASSELVSPVDELYGSDHSTQNVVDWDGSYIGTLPCASCPGIEIVLTINDAGYYTLKETYLAENDAVFRSQGRFDWDASGSRITFRGDDRRVWVIGEGTAWLVGEDNKLADEYSLNKQHGQTSFSPPIVQNTGTKLELMVGTVMILEGLYTWGHEVVSFEPCGSGSYYWATGETAIIKSLNDASLKKAKAQNSPYQAVFIKAEIKVLPSATDGFAESYDGVIEILSVKEFSADRYCRSKNSHKIAT
ncbi:copper resistance protein NlpE [Moritella viscosa]|uniref:Uncharacterized protein n=1 Tax=Moritella viscosa TaxID=80854 RepID=A0A090IFY5_9GAMM|nr:copper resistance protein NlpE [Moritella viscosa]CED61106.1 putative lipoprotein [Moritella viscosa]SGY86136.1 Putative uncharacterized protein [Moritella viscosa]SGY86620.1 Putative uncharacterized protein [Moritella viscosa]SGY87772.1 Putative uncharacterized protein [Moritella viscosa]SGY87797.1 Putative uncharacterized protein [Moritella viscosa]